MYICQFEQVGVNAGMFEKTRIRLNSYVFTTLAIRSLFWRYPIFMNVTFFSFWIHASAFFKKSD